MNELLGPLWLSMQIAVIATLLAMFVAVPVAYFHARRRYWGMSIVEAMLVVPLVLPPTVIGYLLIVGLGSRSWIGGWLRAGFDYSIMFRIEGAMLAAAMVALPLIYLPVRAGFVGVEREMEDIARLNGARGWQIFWHVSLPMARRGLASGLMLAFARALGEFGATAMVFGIRDGQSTLPIAVYLEYEQGRMSEAWPIVLTLVGISLVIAVLHNRSSVSRQQ